MVTRLQKLADPCVRGKPAGIQQYKDTKYTLLEQNNDYDED